MNLVQFSAEPLLRVAQAFAATPRIMVEIGRLLRDPNADLDEVVVHLKRDGAVAARLLRVANSAAFAQSQQVASIENAAVLVGLQEMHRVIGAVAVDQFSLSHYPLYGFSGRRLRENALLVALVMEELAGAAQQESQAAYTAGLFRTLGKIALEKLADEGEPLAPFSSAPEAELVQWERRSFGIAANDATATILERWQFPRAIARAIAHHFAPSAEDQPLASLLNFAASAADRLGYGLPGEHRYWLEHDEGCREAGIDSSVSKRHLDRAFAAFERWSCAMG